MPNRLGIITPYSQHERTRVAISIADRAISEGTPASIFAVGACHRAVSPYWDHRINHYVTADFCEWASECDDLLWTIPPDLEMIAIGRRNGARIGYFPFWEDLIPEHAPNVVACDVWLLPHCAAAEGLCQAWGSERITQILIPWHNMRAATTHRRLSDVLQVMFPLYDGQNTRVHTGVFEIIADVLQSCRNVHVTVCVGTGWHLLARERLRRLQRQFEQLSVVYRPDAIERAQLLANCDLVVQPANYESLGLIALDAITAGVPVCAWDIEPTNEFLHDGGNAMLVPAASKTTWLGMPLVVSDYAVFGEHLRRLLHNKDHLATMTASVSIGLPGREAHFSAGWQAYRNP
jgi:glycosyltransferase involved in cell wall biosynthesis